MAPTVHTDENKHIHRSYLSCYKQVEVCDKISETAETVALYGNNTTSNCLQILYITRSPADEARAAFRIDVAAVVLSRTCATVPCDDTLQPRTTVRTVALLAIVCQLTIALQNRIHCSRRIGGGFLDR